jgi:hypothetical protein
MIEALDLVGAAELCLAPHCRGRGYKRGYACSEIIEAHDYAELLLI